MTIKVFNTWQSLYTTRNPLLDFYTHKQTAVPSDHAAKLSISSKGNVCGLSDNAKEQVFIVAERIQDEHH